jgi:hypothetical protein
MGALLKRLILGVPLVLAVCMLSMWGRGRIGSHPQHTMRWAAATGRFLSNFKHATNTLRGKTETPTPAE